MKLQCLIEVINRTHNILNDRTKGKYLKSTLALGKEAKTETEYFIIHFSSNNKCGTKYKVKCIKHVFVRCLNEGKATLRFEEPPHDLCIKSEVIQLKSFMKLLKNCITGDIKKQNLPNLSSLSVTKAETAPTKLVIKDRNEFPSKGFPRTLETLSLAGLKLCNFRRDILLLRQLVILDLSNNEIEKIPYEFGRMQNLCELYLSNNKLGTKENVDWRWLLGPELTKSLKLLDLSGNQLKDIPKSIWKHQRLVTLKLDSNKLTELPATIGRISTLRYFTIANNDLSSLPCSLLQCHLEYIDLSSNKFHTSVYISKNREHSPWDFYIGSLVNLSAQVVLRKKMNYDSRTIPWTIVEFLDNANMCVCGKPVVNSTFYIEKDFDLKDFCRVVVFDNNKYSSVNFQCYFCSPRCFV